MGHYSTKDRDCTTYGKDGGKFDEHTWGEPSATGAKHSIEYVDETPVLVVSWIEARRCINEFEYYYGGASGGKRVGQGCQKVQEHWREARVPMADVETTKSKVPPPR